MTFIIHKRVEGPYLNSPVSWERIGTVDADTAQGAALRAILIAGTAAIRVIPQDEEWKTV
jgi:hypothetical protein